MQKSGELCGMETRKSHNLVGIHDALKAMRNHDDRDILPQLSPERALAGLMVCQ
jgi:hypothetical protein